MREPTKIPIAGAAARPRPGDTREIDQAGLDRLQLADGVYDSYTRTYALDGLRWRIESKVCFAGGRTIYTLRADYTLRAEQAE